MSSIDFSEISIVTHIRLDTSERLKNIQLRDLFYRNTCINCEFIYIEDDITQKFYEYTSTDTYHLYDNDSEYQRPLCYNIGAKLSNRKFIYFLDADCIIHPKHIIRSTELLTDSNIGAINPYNGTAFYTYYNVKRAFEKVPTYETLNSFFPVKLYTRYRDENLLVGNTNAMGGAWLARKDNFKKYNGFNALFKGWGYEDNEFPVRLEKLGFKFQKYKAKDAVLWHLPHDCEGESLRSTNKYLDYNKSQLQFVQRASRDEILQYITSW